ncbi:MAG: type II secretion system protein N [Betaproteobacteria bacterium]
MLGSTRNFWLCIAAGFLAGLLIFFPARVIEDSANESLVPPWHLTLSGTIWRGAGVLQAGATDASAVPFTWRFNASPLARLRLGWNVVATAPGLSGSALVGAGMQTIELTNAALTMDAALLQQAIPAVAIVAPSGNVFLSTPDDGRLVFDYGQSPRMNGEGRLKVENFGLRPLGPAPVGTHEVSIKAQDTSIAYVFTQSSGALKFEGKGSMQILRPHQLAYSGFVTASPSLPENIHTQLKSLGPTGADGRIRVDWKAAW